MSSIGFFTLSGTGHLNPATALGRRLRLRGHDVTFFQIPVARALISSSGLKYVRLGSETPRADREPNVETSRETVFTRVLESHAVRVLRYGPDAVKSAGVRFLIIDQADLAAGTVAELLDLRFINLSLIPPLTFNDNIPPFNTCWRPRPGLIWRLRNKLANARFQRIFAPALTRVNEQRKHWKMRTFNTVQDAFSTRAIISQLPAILDFQPHEPASRLYYTGPFHDGVGRHRVTFPWHRLNGKPVVYASMGTVRNTTRGTFDTIIAACEELDVQLVLSLGGGELTPETFGPVGGDTIVVHFAPQLELLRQTRVTITHAGVNTTLESLACGVPIVAIPVTDDQPGMAARIEAAGVGVFVPVLKLSASELRRQLFKVLTSPAYRNAAEVMQAEIAKQDGLEAAAAMIDSLVAEAG